MSRNNGIANLAKKRELLRGTYLFSEISDDDADAILAYSSQVSYAAGQSIFTKGEVTASMMAVLRGRVRISAPSDDGKEVVFSIMGPGEVFGEIALLDGRERTADAVAMADCELLVVERRAFLPLLERRPDLCIRLLVLLCERLRRTDEQVEDVSFRHLENRLAKTLLRLAHEHGHKEQGLLRIDLELSQTELGNIVGGSRESINKHMRALRRSGIVALDRGRIVIRDIAALELLG